MDAIEHELVWELLYWKHFPNKTPLFQYFILNLEFVVVY